MSSFVPEEDLFPEEILQKIVNDIFNEGLEDQILSEATTHVPTEFEALENFLSEKAEGFYIADLSPALYYISILTRAVNAFGTESSSLFQAFLNILSKPILESKSNERLTSSGMNLIEYYFSSVGDLWKVCPLPFKLQLTEVIKQLTTDQKQNINNSELHGVRFKITDLDYLLNRMHASDFLKRIAMEFYWAAESLNYANNIETEEIEQNGKTNQSTPSKVNANWTLEQELAFYGVPVNNSNDHSLTSQSAPLSPTFEPDVDSKAILRELTQLMLDICLNITHRSLECSIKLCSFGLSNGISLLLFKDFARDKRDKRIMYLLELFWNILEPYIEQLKSTLPQNSIDRISKLDINLDNEIVDLQKSLETLYSLLTFYIYDGYRQSDKECRNEVMILLSLLAEFPNAVGFFIQTQLYHFIITYSCVEEVGKSAWNFFPKIIANSRNFGTASDSDLEFKKLSWMTLTVLLKDHDIDAILCLAASPLISCLFLYLEFDLHSAAVVKGTMQENSSLVLLPGGLLSASIIQPTQSILSSPTSPTASFVLGDHHQSIHHSLAQDLNKPSHSQSNLMTTSMHSKDLTTMTSKGTKSKHLITLLTPSKLKEFQLLASQFMVHNIPSMLTEFERLEGAQRIVSLILKYCNYYLQEEVSEYQNIILNLLILLNRCISQSTSIKDFFVYNRGVELFLYIYSMCHGLTGVEGLGETFAASEALNVPKSRRSTGNKSRSTVGQPNNDELCAQCIRNISILSGEDAWNVKLNYITSLSESSGPSAINEIRNYCQEEFFILSGINLLLYPLQQYVKKRPPLIGQRAGVNMFHSKSAMESTEGDIGMGPLENPYGGEISVLIISILNCFQNTIIGNSKNEMKFAEFEGVDSLLDLFEVSSNLLRLHILRFLSNLFRNSYLLSYVYCWRSGKTLRSASQVFCHAWLDEETRLDTIRKENGVICDLFFNPLGNQDWPLADYETPLIYTAVHSKETSNLNTQSLTVSKLASAILAARNAIETNLPVEISDAALAIDMRVVLSNVFYLMGMLEAYQIHDESNPFKASLYAFDESKVGLDAPSSVYLDSPGKRTQGYNNQYSTIHKRTIAPTESGFDDIKLTPKERQILVIAKKFIALKEGQWWREVQSYLDSNKITPIDADLALIDGRLEYAFDAAMAAQTEQMKLHDENEGIKIESENQFIDQILVKKQQQIKAEWLKRNAKNNKKRNKKGNSQ